MVSSVSWCQGRFHSYILLLVSSVLGFHKCRGFLGFMVSLVSWFYGFVVSWFHGFLVFRGFMNSWFHGFRAFAGFVVSWFCGLLGFIVSLVSGFHSVLLFHGFRSYTGFIVFNAFMVSWFHGFTI